MQRSGGSQFEANPGQIDLISKKKNITKKGWCSAQDAGPEFKPPKKKKNISVCDNSGPSEHSLPTVG
jgi:hypothetical protein